MDILATMEDAKLVLVDDDWCAAELWRLTAYENTLAWAFRKTFRSAHVEVVAVDRIREPPRVAMRDFIAEVQAESSRPDLSTLIRAIPIAVDRWSTSVEFSECRSRSRVLSLAEAQTSPTYGKFACLR